MNQKKDFLKALSEALERIVRSLDHEQVMRKG